MAKNKTAPLVVKGIFFVVLFIVLTVLACWAATAIFMAVNNMDYTQAKPSYLFEYIDKAWNHPTYKKSIQISTFLSFAIAYGVPLLIWFNAQPKESLHGDARWAKTEEVNKAGLLKIENTSLIVGRLDNGRLVYSDGNSPVTLAAPSRSGKGVSFIVPNLFTYSDSAVVLDIKGENYRITSGHRKKQGQEIFVFAPYPLTSEDVGQGGNTDFRTHCWNPLDAIRRNSMFRESDISEISYIIWPDPERGDNFWQSLSRQLFNSLVSFLIQSKSNEVTLAEVRSMGRGKGKSLEEYLSEILSAYNEKTFEDPISYPAISSECAEGFNSFITMADKTRSSAQQTFLSGLEPFLSRHVAYATSKTDFNFSDLRRKKTTIYFVIPIRNLDTGRLLLNMFFSQLIKANTTVLPEDDKSLKYQTTLFMDEFTAAGTIKEVEKSISYIAGYALRLVVIIQNKAQLMQYYERSGKAIMLGNSRTSIIYTPAKESTDDANEYSQMLGNKTVKVKNNSRSVGGTQSGSNSTISDSLQKRPLMLPQEILEMPLDEEILMIHGLRPIKAKMIKWYEDKEFKDLQITPAPIPLANLDLYSAKADGKASMLQSNDILELSDEWKIIENSVALSSLINLVNENTTVEEAYKIGQKMANSVFDLVDLTEMYNA